MRMPRVRRKRVICFHDVLLQVMFLQVRFSLRLVGLDATFVRAQDILVIFLAARGAVDLGYPLPLF